MPVVANIFFSVEISKEIQDYMGNGTGWRWKEAQVPQHLVSEDLIEAYQVAEIKL